MASQDLPYHNLREIEGLNQRGGETLSIARLIAVGTLDLSVAAYLLAAVSSGATMLTAARPGGAGKSTLLASMLSFLPPGEAIETVSNARDVAHAFSTRLPETDERPADSLCWLAHEIGSGHYYGYIWARDAAQFLSIPRRSGHRIASCVHADTLPELREIFTSEPLRAAPEDFDAIGVILFMHVDASRRHRVNEVWERRAEGHRLLYKWQQLGDRFVSAAAPAVAPERLAWARETIQDFLREGNPDFGRQHRHIQARYEEMP